MHKRNRVVITGMGVLAPNGIGLEAFWDSLLQGRSGIGPITHFDATDFKSRIAGEVKDFHPLDYIEPELKPKRMARHTQLAYAASMMAIRDAGLVINESDLPQSYSGRHRRKHERDGYYRAFDQRLRKSRLGSGVSLGGGRSGASGGGKPDR